MLYLIIQRGIIWKLNKVELWYTALRVIARNMHKKFGVNWTMMTKLCHGQDILYKNQSKGNNEKWSKVELWLLCTALHCQNMHTKNGVIWTYDDKVMLRTRNAQ